MSERDRPSLTGLTIKRPLADRGKPVVSIDDAESALLGDPPTAPPPVHMDVQSPVLSNSLLKPKRKDIKIAWTFKIPHALHQELAAVAAHNDLTMSDIVIEAIQFHLPNFPHPPARKQFP